MFIRDRGSGVAGGMIHGNPAEESAARAAAKAVAEASASGSGLHVQLQPVKAGEALRFDTRLALTLAGSERFGVLPLGGSNDLQLKSPWPHPGFSGLLPKHDIRPVSYTHLDVYKRQGLFGGCRRDMRVGLRVLLGYFAIVALTGVLLAQVFVQQIKPGVRQTMEDTLIDTANLLAELAADDMKAGHLADGRFAAAVAATQHRDVGADIYGFDKLRTSYRITVTDARGIVVYDLSLIHI